MHSQKTSNNSQLNAQNSTSHSANNKNITTGKTSKPLLKHGNRKTRSEEGGDGEEKMSCKISVKKNVRFCHSSLQNAKPVEAASKNVKNTKKKKGKESVQQYKYNPEVAEHLPHDWSTKWKPACHRWVARMEHLHEMDLHSVKLLPAKPPIESLVRFCDNQRHLLLGNGPDFSAVYMGILSDGSEVAVKKINIKRVPLLLEVQTAKAVMSLPSHPLLTKTHFITRDKTHFYVVKELGDYSLKQELRRNQYVSEPMKQSINVPHFCHEIAKAVSHLHSNNVLHMALKPENVIVSASGHDVSLTDYGIHARVASKLQDKNTSSSSQCWLPCEVLKCENDKSRNKFSQVESYTKATDVAALGMLFYYIMTEGGHPFGDYENASEACANNILHGNYNLKALTNPFAHHLVKNMIFKEPEKRFTIDQVLRHPYFLSDIDRDQYVEALAKAAVGLYDLQDMTETGLSEESSHLIDFLKAKESAILSSYAGHQQSSSLHAHFDSIRDLLIYVDKCSRINGGCTEVDARSSTGEAVWSFVPGLLLYTFSEFTLGQLQRIAEELVISVKTKKCSILLQALSTDSGLESPGIDLEKSPFMSSSEDSLKQGQPVGEYISEGFHSSDQCISTDDGIDVVTPLSGSLTDDVFFKCSGMPTSLPIHCKNGWGTTPELAQSNVITSPGSYSSSVDNHFEFDQGDSIPNGGCDIGDDFDPKLVVFEGMPLWTDIDELD